MSSELRGVQLGAWVVRGVVIARILTILPATIGSSGLIASVYACLSDVRVSSCLVSNHPVHLAKSRVYSAGGGGGI